MPLEPETTTAQSLRLIREEWERPLRERIAVLEAAMSDAIITSNLPQESGAWVSEILSAALGAGVTESAA